MQQVYVRQRNYDQAIESLQRALKLTRELPDRHLEMRTWGSLGIVYLDQGQREKAIASYQQALAIAQELGDRRAEGQASEGIGLCYLSLGPGDASLRSDPDRYARAIAAFQHSLSIARELKDASAQEIALNNLGVAYRNSGEYRKSIEYFQEALTFAQELRNELEQARGLNNLGKAYFSMYEYTRALKYFQQSLAIAQKIQHPELELDVLGTMGEIYHYLGDYQQAWQSYQRALRISRYLNDRHTEGRLLNLLGAIYRISGNYEKSIEYRQQSLAIAQKFKDYHWQITNLNDLGIVYSQLNQLSRALEYYQQGLQIDRKQKKRVAEGRLLGSIGLVYLQQGRYPEAIKVLEQGLAIGQKVQDNRRFEASFLVSLGIAFNFSDRPEEAERSLRQAMQIYESLRAGLEDRYKVSLFDIQSDAYANLQQVLIAQNRPEAALEIAERGAHPCICRPAGTTNLWGLRYSSIRNIAPHAGGYPANCQTAKLYNRRVFNCLTHRAFHLGDSTDGGDRLPPGETVSNSTRSNQGWCCFRSPSEANLKCEFDGNHYGYPQLFPHRWFSGRSHF
ncbi:tetratricopeptide repeat protein [Leptothermofonsia sp. ETS-13]|uniref:tetratricopeptide repeat protein n=1 Tax=Leptothermofonsia sp. ETS-13 TaxID=3035696 RepID=UPI003BA3A6D3